jgi:hypothetical protein
MKNFLQILTIILLIVIFTNNAKSEIISDNTTQKIENAKDTINDFSNTQDKGSYLAEEWTSFIKNSPRASYIYKLDPLFKFLWGQGFSLSWAFVTAFLIWTLVFATLYPPLKFSLKNGLFTFAITLISSALICQLAMPTIILKLSLFVKNIWYNLLDIFLLLFLIVIASKLSKQLTFTLKKHLERKKLNKLENEAKKSKDVREGFEETTKGYEEVINYRKSGAGWDMFDANNKLIGWTRKKPN